MPQNSRIAVLGAGLQGALCGLELADRGCDVILFEQNSDAVLEASLINEGKIHLGYIFTNDDLARTAQLMATSAATFTPLLGRWMSAAALEKTASAPFYYLAMRDSLLGADALEARYKTIDDMVGTALQTEGNAYFGARDLPETRRLPAAEWTDTFNDQHVAAAFQTPERSVHLPTMAAGIRKALRDHPRIECRFRAEVTAIRRDARGYAVHLGEAVETGFAHVVNALWSNRLKIDATLGIETTRPFLMRRKVANYVTIPDRAQTLPCATMVLGPYGDIVAYPDGSHFLSWYPTGCIGRSTDVDLPPDWSQPLKSDRATEVFADAVDSLDQRIFGVRDALHGASEVTTEPGVIFTWGRGEVDEPDSELHQRFDVGPQTHWGTYHSVDTGKLSLAPYFALMTADRIAPR